MIRTAFPRGRKFNSSISYRSEISMALAVGESCPFAAWAPPMAWFGEHRTRTLQESETRKLEVIGPIPHRRLPNLQVNHAAEEDSLEDIVFPKG